MWGRTGRVAWQVSRAGVRVVSRPSTSPFARGCPSFFVPGSAKDRHRQGTADGLRVARSSRATVGSIMSRPPSRGSLQRAGRDPARQIDRRAASAADWTPPLTKPSMDNAIPWSRPTDGAPNLGFLGGNGRPTLSYRVPLRASRPNSLSFYPIDRDLLHDRCIFPPPGKNGPQQPSFA